MQHPHFQHASEGELDIALYDIALIRVDHPLEFNRFVNRVGLSAALLSYLGKSCIGVGFGETTMKTGEMEALKPPRTSPNGRTVPRAGKYVVANSGKRCALVTHHGENSSASM